MVIGVLALQGNFTDHQLVLDSLKLNNILVRKEADLEAIDALIIPGGESTVIMKLMQDAGLDSVLKNRVTGGMPVFGICAGAIVLSNAHLGLIDIDVQRNAYGSQLQSFATTLEVAGVGTVEAEFIRAPKITHAGPAVEVLAKHEGVPVVVRQGNVMASTCHTETLSENRLHQLFTELLTVVQ